MISQLSSEHEIHANLIRAWKRQLLEGEPSVFASNGARKQRDQEAQEAELYEQIGRLNMEIEWLKEKGIIYDSTQPSHRKVNRLWVAVVAAGQRSECRVDSFRLAEEPDSVPLALAIRATRLRCRGLARVAGRRMSNDSLERLNTDRDKAAVLCRRRERR